MPDEIYRVMVMIADTGQLAECDAIKYQGKLWLVPNWLDSPAEQSTRPERIIYMDGLRYQEGVEQGGRKFDYTLSHPIPIAVLYGPDPSQAEGGFVVVLSPDIKFPRRSGGSTH
jgi:hypothetical protein